MLRALQILLRQYFTYSKVGLGKYRTWLSRAPEFRFTQGSRRCTRFPKDLEFVRFFQNLGPAPDGAAVQVRGIGGLHAVAVRHAVNGR